LVTRKKKNDKKEKKSGPHIESKSMSLTDFHAALKKSKREVVDLSFPKMHLDSLLHLSTILEEPLDSMFDVGDADFGSMCKKGKELGLCISQLVHNVRVVIDERGEAPPPEPVEQGAKEAFNYPFDIYLMNPTQDQIFLCGRIADPDPSIPFLESILREENEANDNIPPTNDDEVIDIGAAANWKLCCNY